MDILQMIFIVSGIIGQPFTTIYYKLLLPCLELGSILQGARKLPVGWAKCNCEIFTVRSKRHIWLFGTYREELKTSKHKP